jgi:DivIVA domain-containing protein
VAQVYRGGRFYGTGTPTRLTPYEIRARAFVVRWRGLDPDQVRAFQREVADDVADLHQAVRLLGAENDRLRGQLRDWRSAHAQHCGDQQSRQEQRDRLDRRRNQGPW